MDICVLLFFMLIFYKVNSGLFGVFGALGKMEISENKQMVGFIITLPCICSFNYILFKLYPMAMVYLLICDPSC